MSYEKAVSIQLLMEGNLAEDSQHQRMVKSSTEVCKCITSQNLILLAEVAECLAVTIIAGLPSLLQKATGGKLHEQLCPGTRLCFEAEL